MIVLDSSFIVAFHNERDIHHPAAAALMNDIAAGQWGRSLLLEYVFVEVVTVLMARRGLDVATRVGEILLGAREIDFVACSDVFLDALDVFRTQSSGGLSFADAAIVSVARSRAEGQVATFDTDFKGVKGITALPD